MLYEANTSLFLIFVQQALHSVLLPMNYPENLCQANYGGLPSPLSSPLYVRGSGRLSDPPPPPEFARDPITGVLYSELDRITGLTNSELFGQTHSPRRRLTTEEERANIRTVKKTGACLRCKIHKKQVCSFLLEF